MAAAVVVVVGLRAIRKLTSSAPAPNSREAATLKQPRADSLIYCGPNRSGALLHPNKKLGAALLLPRMPIVSPILGEFWTGGQM
jgi:hypothetical protein